MELNDSYMHEIMEEFVNRHAFAQSYCASPQSYPQLTHTSFYNDDVDICFVFNVRDSVLKEIDVYANHASTELRGYVYKFDKTCTAQQIEDALLTALNATSVSVEEDTYAGDAIYSYTAT